MVWPLVWPSTVPLGASSPFVANATFTGAACGVTRASRRRSRRSRRRACATTRGMRARARPSAAA
eukprot:4299218-Prymnesium_polylepis.1